MITHATACDERSTRSIIELDIQMIVSVVTRLLRMAILCSHLFLIEVRRASLI